MIKFKICGQIIRNMTKDTVVADTIKYLEAEFDFSDEWTGFTKTAHFRNGDNKYSITIVNNAISAEKGLNLASGRWYVFLTGVKDGARITTNEEPFTVMESGVAGADLFPDEDISDTENLLQVVKTDGDGTKYLSDDGTYKYVSGGSGGGTGTQGPKGDTGADGKSAYQIAQDNGYTGTQAEWLLSLHGEDGTNGQDGANGTNGQDGKDGKDGANGTDGTNGQDGVSPTVDISKTGNITTVTITDATGAHVATVNDGADGADGSGASVEFAENTDTESTDKVVSPSYVSNQIATAKNELTPEFKDETSLDLTTDSLPVGIGKLGTLTGEQEIYLSDQNVTGIPYWHYFFVAGDNTSFTLGADSSTDVTIKQQPDTYTSGSVYELDILNYQAIIA